jgi:hypothetical protein
MVDSCRLNFGRPRMPDYLWPELERLVKGGVGLGRVGVRFMSRVMREEAKMRQDSM